MISLIILALAGIFMFPIYELLQHWGTIGDLLVLAMGFFIGWNMCNLSGNSYGIVKMLVLACLFIAFVGYWGIIGWIIAIVIAAMW